MVTLTYIATQLASRQSSAYEKHIHTVISLTNISVCTVIHAVRAHAAKSVRKINRRKALPRYLSAMFGKRRTHAERTSRAKSMLRRSGGMPNGGCSERRVAATGD